MADTETQDGAKPLFTEKEERVLKVAWLCLKSGPPDVDIKRLIKLANFNTEKTAANTWSVIKKKLLTMGDANGFNVAVPSEGNGDKAKRGRPSKKRDSDAANAEGAEDQGDGSPKKKARKGSAKKGKTTPISSEESAVDVKEEAGNDE